jgi:hypothetical protein
MSVSRKWILAPAFASVLLGSWSCAEPVAPRAEVPVTRAVNTGVAEGPALIECPTGQAASAEGVIGILGGSVTAGGTTIDIPPGAVLLPRTFRVDVPASRYMEVAITAVGSGHYQFAVPVSVTVDYSRCGRTPATEGPLAVYYIADITRTLLQLMAGTDDKSAMRFTFVTDHLSGYAIAN